MMSGLNSSTETDGVKRVVARLKCKVCAEFVNKIRGRKSFSQVLYHAGGWLLVLITLIMSSCFLHVAIIVGEIRRSIHRWSTSL